MLVSPVATGFCEYHANCSVVAAPATAVYSMAFLGMLTCLAFGLVLGLLALFRCVRSSFNYHQVLRRQRNVIVLPNGKRL